MMPSSNPLVLIAEDDPADRNLMRRILSGDILNVEITNDGADIVDYMQSTLASDAPAPRPDLIVIDLNMPRLNGHQVLSRLRGNKVFSSIPVIVFSSSNRQSDIDACYDAQCSSYIVKPTGLEPFTNALETIVEYWLRLVESRTADSPDSD